jgi:hypothetical protein
MKRHVRSIVFELKCPDCALAHRRLNERRFHMHSASGWQPFRNAQGHTCLPSSVVALRTSHEARGFLLLAYTTHHAEAGERVSQH